MNSKWLYPKSIPEAIAAQKEMAEQVLLKDLYSHEFYKSSSIFFINST